jgi:hypothetical protein
MEKHHSIERPLETAPVAPQAFLHLGDIQKLLNYLFLPTLRVGRNRGADFVQCLAPPR